MPYDLREKRLEYAKAYYLANRERVLACRRKYIAKNSAKIKKQAKNYRLENDDKLKARDKAWREANKAALKQRKKEWRKNNPDYHRDYARSWYAANRKKQVKAKRQAYLESVRLLGGRKRIWNLRQRYGEFAEARALMIDLGKFAKEKSDANAAVDRSQPQRDVVGHASADEKRRTQSAAGDGHCQYREGDHGGGPAGSADARTEAGQSETRKGHVRDASPRKLKSSSAQPGRAC